jgi:hypothetical protein
MVESTIVTIPPTPAPTMKRITARYHTAPSGARAIAPEAREKVIIPKIRGVLRPQRWPNHPHKKLPTMAPTPPLNSTVAVSPKVRFHSGAMMEIMNPTI